MREAAGLEQGGDEHGPQCREQEGGRQHEERDAPEPDRDARAQLLVGPAARRDGVT